MFRVVAFGWSSLRVLALIGVGAMLAFGELCGVRCGAVFSAVHAGWIVNHAVRETNAEWVRPGDACWPSFRDA